MDWLRSRLGRARRSVADDFHWIVGEAGIGKTLAAYLRRADEGTLSRLLVEASILLAASRTNAAAVSPRCC